MDFESEDMRELFSDAMAKNTRSDRQSSSPSPVNRIAEPNGSATENKTTGAEEFTLTPKQAGDILGVGQQTVLNMAKEGKLSHAKRGLGTKPRYFFRMSDIQKLLEKTTEIHIVEDE